MSLYKSEITEKDLMRDFCNEMSEIKAKRIVNGGGKDSNITIYIRVYYSGERLEYYTIYGNQILLNDGKKAYQMNDSESEKMREYLALLGQSPLFHGISPQELEGMLPCLGARELQADKHQMIFRAGDPARWVGLVLSGAVHVIQEDYYGNRSLVALLQPPQLFGEAFSCAGVDTLPVTVEAAQDSRILLLDCQRVLTTCDDACVFHRRLVTNLLKVIAAKTSC